MTVSFNLIDHPWIPVQTHNGDYREVGLRDLLYNAQDYWRLAADTPLLNASILPLTIALLSRVFNGQSNRNWHKLYQARAFPRQPLDDYFAQWYERFDLLHPQRPFYQQSDERVERKSPIHLVHSIGNTGTLFTHVSDDAQIALSLPRVTQWLIAAQLFRTAGLSGLPEKFTDGPFARGVLFWAWHNNLFDTLALNLFRPQHKHMPTKADDKPAWEADDPFYNNNKTPLGYLDYLTWQTNRIQLFAEEHQGEWVVRQMTIAPGRRFDGELVLSPQKRYQKRKPSKEEPNKATYGFLYFDPQKALWRDYFSLLKRTDNDTLPPYITTWLAELADDEYLPAQQPYFLMAIGMLANQAKPMFYRQEILPISLEVLRQPYAINILEEATGLSDEVAWCLKQALKELATHVLMRGGESKPDGSDVTALMTQWDVVTGYWSELEGAFWEFLNQLVTSTDATQADTRRAWRDVLQDRAQQALDQASEMAGQDSGALKGRVVAQKKLHFSLKKLYESKE
jgi:CRISPR system Cascade subunit CasA